MTAWNFGNDQGFLGTMTTPPFTLRTADLVIGVPFKEVRNSSGTVVNDAGLVRVIYGSLNRLSPVAGVYTFG